MRGPIPLGELTPDDEIHFGAKATCLGRMVDAELPVPDGFVVSFLDEEPTEADGQAIIRAWREWLAGAPVAVRSSAVGEDGGGASFAGQHETVLDVTKGESLLAAVRACLRSRSARGAAVYRERLGAEVGAMGVVVQRMVPAEFAGVCFTRAPDSTGALVLEVVSGLGEALVAGQARPGRVVLGRDDLAPRGSEEAGGVLAAFGPDAVRAVARRALAAEALFGTPQDVEWAWVDGSCRLLQARPITATDRGSERERIRREEILRLEGVAGDRLAVWTDFSMADMLPAPTPMAVEFFHRAVRHDGGVGRAFRRSGFLYARNREATRFVEEVCGRCYMDLGRFLRAVIPELPVDLDPRVYERDAGVDLDLGALPVRFDGRRPWRIFLLPLTLARAAIWIPLRFLAMRRTLHRRFRHEALPTLQEEAAQERAVDLGALTGEELADRLSRLVERLTDELFTWHQLSDVAALGTRTLLMTALHALYGSRAGEVEAELTTALDGNFNTDTNLDLARVAAGELEMEEFLDRYGQRGFPDWDPGAARWREDASRVERMVALVAESGTDPLAAQRQRRELRRQAEQRLDRDLRRHVWLWPLRRRVLGELARFQRYSPLREATQGACYLWVELIRRVLLEGGRRLGAGDVLTWLTVEQAVEAIRGGRAENGDVGRHWVDRARATRRRQALARTIPLPHALRSDDLEAIGRPPPIDPEARELRGTLVCGGTVRGRARVVAALDEAADLEPGEILITRSTDPAWTPLFMVAGGLVLEQGGTLSHGAIVARELGLPAVVNVDGATGIVRSGDRVLLDADRGVLVILDRD